MARAGRSYANRPIIRRTVFGPSTYYVSATGSDSADGLSTSTPWATVSKVNAATLGPGDTVLFKGGDSWSGTMLYPNITGTPSAVSPVTIGAYGTGRPTLANTGGYAIYRDVLGGLVFRDLILVGGNTSSTAYTTSAGIGLYKGTSGRADSIVVDGCDISGFKNGIEVGGASGGGYSTVTITGTVAHGCRDQGIFFYGPSWSGATYAHAGVTITGTTAHSNPGDPSNTTTNSGSGILLGSVDGGLVQYCATYNNGASCSAPEGPAGAWAYDSNALLFTDCVSYSNLTGGSADGDGFDLDLNTSNSRIERCLSYGNAGAGILLYASPSNSAWTTNTVRYNVCYGNGVTSDWYGEVTLAGNAAAAAIYGNTLVAVDHGAQTPSPIAVKDANPASCSARNNILVAAGTAPLVDHAAAITTTDITYQGNRYHRAAGFSVNENGTDYTSLTGWQATGQEMLTGSPVGSTGAPGLVNAALPTTTDPTLLRAETGYLLGPSAPAAVTVGGLDLATLFGTDLGTVDFFGQALTVPLSAGAAEAHLAALPAAAAVTGSGSSVRSATGRLDVAACPAVSGSHVAAGVAALPAAARGPASGSSQRPGVATVQAAATGTGSPTGAHASTGRAPAAPAGSGGGAPVRPTTGNLAAGVGSSITGRKTIPGTPTLPVAACPQATGHKVGLGTGIAPAAGIATGVGGAGGLGLLHIAASGTGVGTGLHVSTSRLLGAAAGGGTGKAVHPGATTLGAAASTSATGTGTHQPTGALPVGATGTAGPAGAHVATGRLYAAATGRGITNVTQDGTGTAPTAAVATGAGSTARVGTGRLAAAGNLTGVGLVSRGAAGTLPVTVTGTGATTSDRSAVGTVGLAATGAGIGVGAHVSTSSLPGACVATGQVSTARAASARVYAAAAPTSTVNPSINGEGDLWATAVGLSAAGTCHRTAAGALPAAAAPHGTSAPRRAGQGVARVAAAGVVAASPVRITTGSIRVAGIDTGRGGKAPSCLGRLPGASAPHSAGVSTGRAATGSATAAAAASGSGASARPAAGYAPCAGALLAAGQHRLLGAGSLPVAGRTRGSGVPTRSGAPLLPAGVLARAAGPTGAHAADGQALAGATCAVRVDARARHATTLGASSPASASLTATSRASALIATSI